MDLATYIIEKCLILVPALLVLGSILKGTEKVKDKYIPVILLPLGIGGAIALGGLSVDSIIQGILVTGVSVYCNQLLVQGKKSE